MMRILIIQTASIGDVILATPLIEKLHRFYPQASIDFLTKRGNESLFFNHPLLNEVLIWDKKGGKYRNLLHLLKKVRATRYQLVINVQRFATTGLFTALSRAEQTVGFSKNPFSFLFTRRVKHVINSLQIHEVRRNLNLIEALTDDEFQTVKLYPSEGDDQHTAVYKEYPYVCIAPASLWFTKQYPEERWVEFLDFLPGEYRVYLLGAKGDNALCERLINKTRHTAVVNLAGKLSLLQTASLMRDAVMNYVNDSAPLHLASSQNAPVTAIFCSTVLDFGFGPLSDQAKVVETEVELDCRPCGLHGHRACPKGHFKCAYTIEVDQLIERLPEPK